MATKRQQAQQAKQKAISDRQMARLEAKASEKRIAELARKELKKMTTAAEKAEAKRRAEAQFQEMKRQGQKLERGQKQ